MKIVFRISKFIYSITNWITLALAFVIFIIFLIFVLPNESLRSSEATGVAESPDTSFIYSAEDLYDLAERFGEDGRAYYIKARFTFDIVWPISYLLFLVISLSALLKSLSIASKMKLLNVIPLISFVLDLLENITSSIVMARYPLLSPGIAELAPIFTFLKWIFVGISFLLLMIAIVVASINQIDKHKKVNGR